MGHPARFGLAVSEQPSSIDHPSAGLAHGEEVGSDRLHPKLQGGDARLNKATCSSHRASDNGNEDVENEVHHQHAAESHQRPARSHGCVAGDTSHIFDREAVAKDVHTVRAAEVFVLV